MRGQELASLWAPNLNCCLGFRVTVLLSIKCGALLQGKVNERRRNCNKTLVC